MKVGIVGLPNVGKSTLFNALTNAGAASANYPFCTIEPNTGIVAVPDARLATINKFIETKKIVPALLTVVDIAGLVKGASEGAGLGNKFLSHIREVDAILHVVRCFDNDDITHVEGAIDPVRDAKIIENELLLADLGVAESSLDRIETKAKRFPNDKEVVQRATLLRRCADALQDGIPLRAIDFSAEELVEVKALGMMTAKNVLFVGNVDEAGIHGETPHAQALLGYAKQQGGRIVLVSAAIEADLATLDGNDRKEFLDSYGMNESALQHIAHEGYELLGLQSYFTAGLDEIRAWTIRKGATAPEAAGVIHTDFQRGFIRVEVYSVADLEQYKTEAAIRAAGKLRTEGKQYVMQDSDVCHFLFNV